MRIVFCINYFLPYQVAGTEVYTFQLAKYFQSKGYITVVVFPNRNGSVPSYYEVEGLPVYTYEETDVNDKALMRGERPPAGLPNFSKLIQQLQPDIVHFQELEASTSIGLYHVKEVARLGYRSVFTLHLSHYTCFTGTLMESLERSCDGVIDESKCTHCSFRTKGLSPTFSRLLGTGARVLKSFRINTGSVSHSMATALSMPFLIEQKKVNLITLSKLVSKLVVITDWYKRVMVLNHVPEESIKVIKQGLPHKIEVGIPELEMPASPLRLVFIGRISQFKGVHLLLDALSGLPADKIILDIYGSSNDDDYTEACKKKTLSMKHVKWKGTLQKEEVLRELRNYHALCLPSTFSEMSPLVIQEAFAAGIPVIASNVYGNAEQVTHGVNGLLFRFNDSASLREQLLHCINNPELVMRLKKAVPLPRSFDEVGAAYYALYKELLALNA
ncbi:glycosyltransferase [Lacibacter sp. H375]|uniref:glycosyltransferase n=1 Tax=Lacibacter sp. H375 TaxID=3133424 RepID=UPI0030C5C967